MAKQFWQHTGDGISSRVAERCLTLLGVIDCDGAELPTSVVEATAEPPAKLSRYGAKNKHYGTKPSATTSTPNALDASVIDPTSIPSSKLRYSTTLPRARSASNSGDSSPPSLANSIDSLPSRRTPTLPPTVAQTEQDEDVLTRYVEERYGRNLDLSLAPLAKLAMRRRIAGVLRETPGQAIPVETIEGVDGEESTRGVVGLTEKDVWLYPCGMSAIWHAHQLVMGAKERQGMEVGKSVCFG